MILIDGPWFKDESGRVLMLRGVNLSGSSKVPRVPDGATYRSEGFFGHRDVSFIGRPFPLEEADEHWARLRAWGLTFVRFLVTWEAIEHAGPGLYDEAYLDYVAAVLEKALAHDIQVVVDFHQDVWSRFSGGDGAPGWTLEVAGLEMRHFAATGAAIVHATHGDPFPRMIWPTNATKLATATMFTLFFGGRFFAPQRLVEGENIQDYLQRHYLAAARRLAEHLAPLPNVIGYDIMNEPLPGYIGWPDLNRHNGLLHQGITPTPFQAMLLGAGYPQDVDVFDTGILGSRVVRRERVDPQGLRAWREGQECVWRQHGVWDVDASGKPRLLRPNYFTQINGRPVDFGQDCLRPFYETFIQTIRAVHPQVLIFIEPEVNQPPPHWIHDRPASIIYAPHWYDGFVLYTKRFLPWLAYDARGRGKVVLWPFIRRNFADQLAEFKHHARERLGNVPVIIGECGIPFDLDNKRAYRDGNFRAHAQAMDRTLRAMEDNLLGYTLWNYTPDNTNAHGDLWNDEDLSIFSRDQQTRPEDVYSGGRALEAILRPYPMKTTGEPLSLKFDYRTGQFDYVFRHIPGLEAPTEIFIPNFHYPHGFDVRVSDGTHETDPTRQVLRYYPAPSHPIHKIHITRR
ncbi:hypothetical protein SE15_09785 [Thermanaerothrix daxensis]|uniref:Glycoside hydrolase family 5 domain-containing protein n=1 Tax=Thermanaerothrix daxensis TaxID=869279 RepID=A0A0P6XPR9_9CHLR|nr:cellulase family glycosylhydrolase [Thermanaerothrix daxensis]KPL82439.1 hypothetical protein SE15_09785 [Thermanaerothrix daxensis]